MKLLISTLSYLAFAVPIAHAMPQGVFECTTQDAKTVSSFIISNYGEQTIEGVSTITLQGQEIKIDTNTRVFRQWVDDKAANIEVSLPAGDWFSKALFIQAQSQDGMTYKGEFQVRVQEDDYSSPVRVMYHDKIECTYSP